RRSTRRWCQAIEIRWKRTAIEEEHRNALAEVVKLIRGRQTGQHAGTIEDIESLPAVEESAAAVFFELMRGRVVAVGPHADVRVVDEFPRCDAGAKVIEVVRAEG